MNSEFLRETNRVEMSRLKFIFNYLIRLILGNSFLRPKGEFSQHKMSI